MGSPPCWYWYMYFVQNTGLCMNGTFLCASTRFSPLVEGSSRALGCGGTLGGPRVLTAKVRPPPPGLRGDCSGLSKKPRDPLASNHVRSLPRLRRASAGQRKPHILERLLLCCCGCRIMSVHDTVCQSLKLYLWQPRYSSSRRTSKALHFATATGGASVCACFCHVSCRPRE